MARKSVLTLLFITMAGLQGLSAAQAEAGQASDYSVPTGPQPRGALLEEFTGIHCGYCPQGHAIAEKLARASERIYVVAVHSGYYSTPGADEPDFRTDEGTALSAEFNTDEAGYPCGMVNRQSPGGGSPVCSRSQWKALAKEAIAETAPVNLLATASYDGATRKLAVHVEGYFTADTQAEGQQLSVLWTQSDIHGPQNGGLMGDEYPHRHVLRGYVTPVWGDAIGTPAQGTYFTRDYTLELPESVNGVEVKPEDINVVAFVGAGKRDVLNVTGCKPAYTNYDKPLAAELSAPTIPIGGRWGLNFFEATLKNKSDKTLAEATFEVSVNGQAQTVAWSGAIEPFASGEITLPCKYDMAASGQNKYSLTLLTANGEPVEPSALSGTFAAPRSATPAITVELKTNNEAGENTFCIKDADGNTVKEFGPYPDGKSTETEESVTLEADRTYYIEVTDRWGDGIYSPAGYLTSRSADGSLIEQVFDIEDYGIRSIFRTDKSTTAMAQPEAGSRAGAQVTAYGIDGKAAYSGPRSKMDVAPGIYMIYDSTTRTVRKEVINR